MIPEAAETLESVDLVGNHFLAVYLKDAHSVVRVFDVHGKHVRDVDLPGLGTATGFHGKRKDGETFYSFTLVHLPGDHLPLRGRQRGTASSGGGRP